MQENNHISENDLCTYMTNPFFFLQVKNKPYQEHAFILENGAIAISMLYLALDLQTGGNTWYISPGHPVGPQTGGIDLTVTLGSRTTNRWGRYVR